jgi:hypothetical protein
MAETIATSLYAPRMGAMLLTVFGGLPLLLASLGIYGVLAFSIARRTPRSAYAWRSAQTAGPSPRWCSVKGCRWSGSGSPSVSARGST